ncbi:hypothetical protein COB57_01700 [Candidatus Peregrinibacteria bacterium]|nr:MAG: hypothetical protein COB57_01700 [Candidatus Peregrinibacteria bacterium]
MHYSSSFSFKKDSYTSARGDYSRMVTVCCRQCDAAVLTYQKDGPGNLRRLYLDRIFSPEKFTNLEKKDVKGLDVLSCPSCKEILGTPYVYEKEKRKAFRMYQDAVVKKLRKL